jgi:hypothetical protein
MKLFSLDNGASDWSGIHLGPIMLAYAMGMSSIASLFLFLIRFFWPNSLQNWFFLPVTFITLLLVFPSLFIVLLGPAEIQMKEYFRSEPK